MQVTDGNGYIYGPNGLQVNGSDGRPKVLSTGGSSGIPHGTASGTDTYTVAITGVTSYADGDAYLVRFTNGNTTGSTLNINGLGAISLYRNNDGELIGGDIEDGAEMLCVYNSTLNVFQVIGTSPNTLLAYVTNAEAITITKGQPVYAFGGQGDRLKVKLAYNTSDATSAQTVGLVLSASIGANQKGFIILNGQLDGLNILPTSTWADGDPVYLGATAGSITKTKPKAPNHLVYLGFVTTASNGSAGRMYVRVQNGYEMDELHDVQITSVANNDLIQYDSASSLWKNRSISSAGIQPTLVSTTNIKSINGNSLLGSGDLTISTSASWGSITGTLSSQTDLNTALSGKASTGAVTGTGITMSTARILGRSTAGTGAIEEITIGSGLTLSAGTLTASGSGLTIGTTAITSGTVGRILFEGTGNVLQESANLFWDNTNSRIGIGTSTPSATLHTTGSVTASGAIARGNYMQPTLVAAANNDTLIGLDIAPTFTNGAFTSVTNMLLNMSSPSVSGASIFVNKYAYNNGWIINIKNGSTNQTGDIFQSYGLELGSSNTNIGGILKGKWGVGYNGATSSVPVTLSVNGSVGIGITTDAGYKLDVNGTSRFSGLMLIANGLQFGQTGAESYLNTSGTTAIQINRKNITLSNGADNQLTIEAGNGGGSIAKIWLGGFSGTQPLCFNGNGRESVFGLDTATPSTSALIRMESTTKGFLPPRMTTTQKNAISSPAAGLVVYDTTLNKLCVRTASAWETITSL